MSRAPAPPAAWRLDRGHDAMNRGGRVVIAVGLIGVAGAILLLLADVRNVEARLFNQVASLLFTRSSLYRSADDPMVWIWNAGEGFGLRITLQCTVALLVVPLLVLGAVSVLVRRMPILPTLRGLSTALVVLVLLNQIRLVMVAYAFVWGGREAFEWAHSLAGSFLMIFGFAGCVILYFWVGYLRPRQLRQLSRTLSAR